MQEAAVFADVPAPTQAFVHALSEDAEGALAAVYLAEGRGYARAAGDVAGVSVRLAADLRVLVSLRADPKPVEVREDGLNLAAGGARLRIDLRFRRRRSPSGAGNA